MVRRVQSSPRIGSERLRRRIAEEIVRRSAHVDACFLDVIKPLKDKVAQLQDSLDEPKHKIKGRFAPEYSAIGTSESGSGSHQRRKDRVNTLFSSGCGMPANVAEFRAQCTGVMDLADALPEICVSGLWEHAKKFVGRGSWCVDLTEECPVCLGRPGPGKSWSTIFHCQHRACSECLDDVLKEKQD